MTQINVNLTGQQVLAICFALRLTAACKRHDDPEFADRLSSMANGLEGAKEASAASTVCLEAYQDQYGT